MGSTDPPGPGGCACWGVTLMSHPLPVPFRPPSLCSVPSQPTLQLSMQGAVRVCTVLQPCLPVQLPAWTAAEPDSSAHISGASQPQAFWRQPHRTSLELPRQELPEAELSLPSSCSPGHHLLEPFPLLCASAASAGLPALWPPGCLRTGRSTQPSHPAPLSLATFPRGWEQPWPHREGQKDTVLPSPPARSKP